MADLISLENNVNTIKKMAKKIFFHGLKFSTEMQQLCLE